MQPGPCRYDDIIRPISGRALPLHKGEVLRITQVEGTQCVDFNCFNLHDYKERMSVGHMRVQGIRVREGHIAVRYQLSEGNLPISLGRAATPPRASLNTASCRAPTARTRLLRQSANTG